ncbi:MAG: helix-turn-helix transcriptional regulator [Actinomycetes bacterium]
MTGATGTAAHLSRLLALVPYLLARPYARLPEVARTFGVTEAQLRRDLDLVFMCGLPGHLPDDLIDVSISGDAITLSNADTIARPLRLSAEEASALLVGLRMLAATPGLQDREALDRLAAKLETAAGDAADAVKRVSVEMEGEEVATAAVRAALEAGRRLHLDYYVPGRDETTSRDVDPMRLLLVEGRPYLEGWCRRVEEVRLFRLDRVIAVEVLDVAAEVPPEAVPRDLDAGLFQPSPEDQVVTLELEPSGRWVSEYYPCESVEDLAGARLRVRLRTPDTRWVRRLALRLAGTGRVVDPPELVADVRADAAAALAAYEGPNG